MLGDNLRANLVRSDTVIIASLMTAAPDYGDSSSKNSSETPKEISEENANNNNNNVQIGLKMRPLLMKAIHEALNKKKNPKNNDMVKLETKAVGAALSHSNREVFSVKQMISSGLSRTRELLNELSVRFPWFLNSESVIANRTKIPEIETLLSGLRMDIEESIRAMTVFFPADIDDIPQNNTIDSENPLNYNHFDPFANISNIPENMKSELDADLTVLDRAFVMDPVRARLTLALFFIRDSLLTRLNRYMLRRFELLDTKIQSCTNWTLPETSYLPAVSTRKENRRKMQMSAMGHSQLKVAQNLLRLEEFIGGNILGTIEMLKGGNEDGKRQAIGRRKVQVKMRNAEEEISLLIARIDFLQNKLAQTETDLTNEINQLEEENKILREPINLNKLPTPQLLMMQLGDLRKQEIVWANERPQYERTIATLSSNLESATDQVTSLRNELVKSKLEHAKQVKVFEDQLRAQTAEYEKARKRFISLDSFIQTMMVSYKAAMKEKDLFFKEFFHIRGGLNAEKEALERDKAAMLRDFELKTSLIERQREKNKALWTLVRDLSARLGIALGKNSPDMQLINNMIAREEQEQDHAAPGAKAASTAAANQTVKTRGAEPANPGAAKVGETDSYYISSIAQLIRDKNTLISANKHLTGRINQMKTELEFKGKLISELRKQLASADNNKNSGSGFIVAQPPAQTPSKQRPMSAARIIIDGPKPVEEHDPDFVAKDDTTDE